MRVVNDRRTQPRVVLTGEAVLHLVRGPLQCVCVDVSAGGMAVLCRRAAKIRERARVEASFGTFPLASDIVVVRGRSLRQGYLWGLQFIALDPATRRNLEAYVRQMLASAARVRQAQLFAARMRDRPVGGSMSNRPLPDVPPETEFTTDHSMVTHPGTMVAPNPFEKPEPPTSPGEGAGYAPTTNITGVRPAAPEDSDGIVLIEVAEDPSRQAPIARPPEDRFSLGDTNPNAYLADILPQRHEDPSLEVAPDIAPSFGSAARGNTHVGRFQGQAEPHLYEPYEPAAAERGPQKPARSSCGDPFSAVHDLYAEKEAPPPSVASPFPSMRLPGADEIPPPQDRHHDPFGVTSTTGTILKRPGMTVLPKLGSEGSGFEGVAQPGAAVSMGSGGTVVVNVRALGIVQDEEEEPANLELLTIGGAAPTSEASDFDEPRSGLTMVANFRPVPTYEMSDEEMSTAEYKRDSETSIRRVSELDFGGEDDEDDIPTLYRPAPAEAAPATAKRRKTDAYPPVPPPRTSKRIVLDALAKLKRRDPERVEQGETNPRRRRFRLRKQPADLRVLELYQAALQEISSGE